MTIDTADKRKSAVNYTERILPVPDGVINAMDRVHIAGFYRVIVAEKGPISDKRKSSVNYMTRMLPVADGVIGSPDRVLVAGFYCGLFGDITPRRLSPKFYY